MTMKILIFAAISATTYLLLALVLTYSQRPEVVSITGEKSKSLDFSKSMLIDFSSLPASANFTARDGALLPLRTYPSSGPKKNTIILVHGSAWHGMQFHHLARQLAASGAGDVIVPDLRGHGFTPAIRGDISYINQLEDDMADLIAHIKKVYGNDREIILGGHSSGGGFVIRFLGGQYGKLADRAVLLAPFLKYDAPTTRQNSGGWAHVATRRLIGLSMLNAIGIRLFNHLPVIAFNMPKEVLEGAYGKTATLQYSYALNTGMAPRSNYENDLHQINQPFLLLAGTKDEAFFAEQYEPVISAQTKTGQYVLVEGAGHLDIVDNPATFSALLKWVQD